MKGEIVIEAGRKDSAVRLRIWPDANYPVINVESESSIEHDIRIETESWRTRPHEPEPWQKLLPVLIRNGCTFPQQLDAMTGAPSKPDGYGPMVLAALEYVSRMHGIHIDVVGIHPEAQTIWLEAGEQQWNLAVHPNQSHVLMTGTAKVSRSAPFDHPFQGTKNSKLTPSNP